MKRQKSNNPVEANHPEGGLITAWGAEGSLRRFHAGGEAPGAGESIFSSKRYYSTGDLAKLFQTNESTVKRWADSGKLKCFKTPGGHRKFPAWRVMEFVAEYRYEITPDTFQSRSPREHPNPFMRQANPAGEP